MNQKRVIIIGASSGIGKELALIYAQQGCRVAITGRRQYLLEELKQVYPERILAVPFDVMDFDPAIIKTMIDKLGGLDLLIYNAGFGDVSKELDYELENTTLRTNVSGFLNIVCDTFNYFIQQGHGQIAVTSSLAALRGNSWAPAYSASKAFVSNYAEGLNIKARRLHKKVFITDARPGFIDTKMSKGNQRFWVASPQKAARQMVAAVEKKRRVVYITHRWWLIAQILKILPFKIYSKLA